MAPIPWEETDPFSISMYAQESAYWNSLQESDTLLRLCGELAQDTERREAVDACVERLCQLCWAEALEAVDCHTLLIAARAEVDHLKRRLSQMNLMNLKQMEVQEKHLLHSLVWDQIPSGDPVEAVEAGVNTEATAEMDHRCEELQHLVAAKEAQLRGLRGNLRTMEDRLAERAAELQTTQERLCESRSQEALLLEALEQLREEHEIQSKAHEDSRQEVCQLQSELLRMREVRANRRWSRKLDGRPPSSPLPLLQGPVSYDAALEESNFVTRRAKAMQVSTSLPSLQRGEGGPSSSLLPKSKRPFVI